MRIEFSPEWLTLIVTLVGAAIAVQTIREATRNSRLEKFAGVLMECTRRYGDLIELRHALNKDVQCADTTTQSASPLSLTRSGLSKDGPRPMHAAKLITLYPKPSKKAARCASVSCARACRDQHEQR